jgi:hypothetical protein
MTLPKNSLPAGGYPDYAGFEARDTAAVFEQDLWDYWLTFHQITRCITDLVVGRVAERLKLADSLVAVSIDFSESNLL